MIVYIKDDELKAMMNKIEDIETNFWLNYRNYHKKTREFLVKQFEDLYKLISDLRGEKQMEIDVDLINEE